MANYARMPQVKTGLAPNPSTPRNKSTLAGAVPTRIKGSASVGSRANGTGKAGKYQPVTRSAPSTLKRA